MRRIIKTCALLSIVICLLLSLSSNALAYELFNGRWDGDLHSIVYNTDNVQTLETLQAIRGAIADWEWHLNGAVNGIDLGVYFVQSSTELRNDITFVELPYVVNGLFSVCDAYTYLYDEQGNMIDPTVSSKNWKKAKIHINAGLFKNMTYEEKKATICHEIGHVFSLAHTTDEGTIMYPTLDNRTAFVPTLDDVLGVYAVYG